jgi:hypothetical protein
MNLSGSFVQSLQAAGEILGSDEVGEPATKLSSQAGATGSF